MAHRLKLPKLKGIDVACGAIVSAYIIWPWWAMHGGPPAPKDLGTLVEYVIGIYGSVKAVTKNSKKAEKKDEDEQAED